jgi:hypothetical protein
MKVTVFWDIVLCNLVEVYQHLGGVYCRHHQCDDYADNGGSMHL